MSMRVMEYGGFLKQYSGCLYVKPLAGAFFLHFFEHQCAERNVRDSLAGVVLVEGNLIGLCPAFLFARQDFADLNEILPLDDATLDRIVDIRLFILNRLLDRNNAKYVAAGQSGVVDLPAFCRGEAA